MSNLLSKLFDNAMRLNKKKILNSLDYNPRARLIDLGCDDGVWTIELAKRIGTKKIFGVDIVEKRIEKAKKKGLIVKKFNLAKDKWPLKSNYFDVVHSNQVIEHISNLDNFISEVYRITKPGGYVVISTENASSWHNIFASLMGWQIFSLTNFSIKRGGIGNPLSLHKNSKKHLSSWTHKMIFNYSGLKEFFQIYKFKKVKIKGAGYCPLPAFFGSLDPRHANFITLKSYK